MYESYNWVVQWRSHKSLWRHQYFVIRVSFLVLVYMFYLGYACLLVNAPVCTLDSKTSVIFPIGHHNHELIVNPETDCAKLFGQRSTKSELSEGSLEPGRGQKRLRDSQGLNLIKDNVGDEDESGELHRNKLAKTLAELSATYNSSGIQRAHANRRYVISFEAI